PRMCPPAHGFRQGSSAQSGPKWGILIQRPPGLTRTSPSPPAAGHYPHFVRLDTGTVVSFVRSERPLFCRGGTTENSPAFQRWVPTGVGDRVPPGTKELRENHWLRFLSSLMGLKVPGSPTHR